MDEQNSSSEGADAGAADGTGEGATADAGATVSRAVYEKALADSSRREEAARKAQARSAQLEQQLADLEAKPRGAPSSDTKTGGGQPPEWARSMMAELAELKGSTLARTREDARTQLLSTVPDGNREAAELMLRGIESSDGLDLTKPADAQAAAAKLSTHTAIFVDSTRGTQRLAAQLGPDGKLTMPDGMTLDDVPAELADQIFSDPEKMEQLRSNTAGVLGSSDKYVI